MSVSVFDIFSIGIGPSSSHTVGPMKAAHAFVCSCDPLAQVSRVDITLYGSLAFTGQGHGTDVAIMMGLEGYLPESIDPVFVKERVKIIREQKTLLLNQTKSIGFDVRADIHFEYNQALPGHTNAMRFVAYDERGAPILQGDYYSIGGGFIQKAGDFESADVTVEIPYPFDSADTLLKLCEKHHMTIAELMWKNELAFRTKEEIEKGLSRIDEVMMACVERGCQTDGVLPSTLKVKRRAPHIYRRIIQDGPAAKGHPHPMNWLNVYSMAVQEENACGGQVVTAPTNGAAGIIPALMKYHRCFDPNPSDGTIHTFLLTAAAVCILYKENASISGAEMGCQGEVGVACSMAAAGLTAARGGTLYQIENAAEIGMEHNLGLTCDPVNGLVQIPCIERNGMGAVKAVNASSLALTTEHRGRVTLDMVIETMRQVGLDMKDKYKETSQGGLAKNVVAC